MLSFMNGATATAVSGENGYGALTFSPEIGPEWLVALEGTPYRSTLYYPADPDLTDFVRFEVVSELTYKAIREAAYGDADVPEDPDYGMVIVRVVDAHGYPADASVSLAGRHHDVSLHAGEYAFVDILGGTRTIDFHTAAGSASATIQIYGGYAHIKTVIVP
jgi:hypothetical protein